ncbi:MAG: DUF4143 domain-containing protein, partial [Treponema sp.]|nr:DUF4143 domain-containing protein [Treponema sp.]
MAKRARGRSKGAPLRGVERGAVAFDPQTSNLVYLLRPWHTNAGSRAVKTPKLYFLDTGLAACLTKWNSPETLRDGAMAGAFFETFVIAEILKSYY